jgi:integrase
MHNWCTNCAWEDFVSRSQSRRRGRVGKVSIYWHHGAWWLYYREAGMPVRRKVATLRDDAQKIAAQINAQLASAASTMLAECAVRHP